MKEVIGVIMVGVIILCSCKKDEPQQYKYAPGIKEYLTAHPDTTGCIPVADEFSWDGELYYVFYHPSGIQVRCLDRGFPIVDTRGNLICRIDPFDTTYSCNGIRIKENLRTAIRVYP